MSDFELLVCLQQELVTTLENRSKTKYIKRDTSKAKIHRLRLQISEVMLRIENECEGFWYKKEEEAWEKQK